MRRELLIMDNPQPSSNNHSGIDIDAYNRGMQSVPAGMGGASMLPSFTAQIGIGENAEYKHIGTTATQGFCMAHNAETDSWEMRAYGVVGVGYTSANDEKIATSFGLEAVGSQNKMCSELGGFANTVGGSVGSGKFNYGLIKELGAEVNYPIDSKSKPSYGGFMGTSTDADIIEAEVHHYLTYTKVGKHVGDLTPLWPPNVLNEAIEEFPKTSSNVLNATLNDFKAVQDGTIYREALDDENFPDANENSTKPSPLNIDEIFRKK